MEFTPLTHCCASGIDFHKTKPVGAWKRQARSTMIPSSFTVAVKQFTEGYYSWQGNKKNFSLCFKRGGLLLVSCSCCCRSQHKWQGNNSSKWSRGQMASEEGLGFSRKKQLRLLDTGRGNIECSFQLSCSSSDQSCNRQAQLCRANNYRAMSSDYYMDNTLQKYRVPVFVMLPLDLIVFGECKQMKLRRYIKLAFLFPLFVVNFFFFLLSSPTLSNWKLLYPYQGSKSKASVHCKCFQALNSQYL
jgi:hypothetical protein